MTSPLIPQAMDPAPGVQVHTCPCCGQADRVILWGYPTHPERHAWWCNRCLGWLTQLAGPAAPAQQTASEEKPKRRKKGSAP